MRLASDILHEACTLSKASHKKTTLALVSAQSTQGLKAVCKAYEMGMATPILLGNTQEMQVIATQLGLPIHQFEQYNLTQLAAAEKAVSLVHAGQADFIMKGAIDTAVLLRILLQRSQGLRTLSSASHVQVLEIQTYHKLLLLTDSALNIAPNLSTKIDMIKNAVHLAKALGIQNPKVAILAAIEKILPLQMPCTSDAAILCQMNRRGQITDCIVDGPLALDIAISAQSAKIKGIESPLAGDVDIILTPCLESGNILCKSLIHLGKARGGGIITGTKVPIVLTSRADDFEYMLLSIALAVLSSKLGFPSMSASMKELGNG